MDNQLENLNADKNKSLQQIDISKQIMCNYTDNPNPTADDSKNVINAAQNVVDEVNKLRLLHLKTKILELQNNAINSNLQQTVDSISNNVINLLQNLEKLDNFK